MYDAYFVMTIEGAYLWSDVLIEFRLHTVRSWGRPLRSKMTNLLMKRDVHVDRGLHFSIFQSLTDVQFKKDHIAFKFSSTNSTFSRHAKSYAQMQQIKKYSLDQGE